MEVVTVQTSDGKTHEVDVGRSAKGDWRASAYCEGKEIAVAGLRSARQAVEHWTTAFEHRND